MSGSRRVMVSRVMVQTLMMVADRMMELDPAMKRAWLDQCCTSRASEEAGGMIALGGEYDWVVGWAIWQLGYPSLLPREG